MRRFVAILLLAGLVTPMAATIRADDAAPPAKKWKNETEASMVSANGNTRSTTTSGKNTFGYKWTHTALELIGGGLGAKSKGVVTAEKYFASEKFSVKLSERNYTFEKSGWEKDRFAGIRDRFDNGVGLGRELVKTTTDSLIAELGAGYVTEDRIGSDNTDFTSGRAYTKYVRTLSPTSTFSQDAEYIHNFDQPKDFRVNTETALTAALSAHFSLKTSYKWQHVDQPPLGFGRNDTLFSVALLATY